MTKFKRQIGHGTLKLKDLDPKVSLSFSPNLYAWMKKKAIFFPDGGVLHGVYRVKPGRTAGQGWAEGSLIIGYPTADNEDDKGFVGTLLMQTLSQGKEAGSACYLNTLDDVEIVDDFWDQYLKLGRCAIDPSHTIPFMDDRFTINEDTRVCLWCGEKHKKLVTSEEVKKISWVPA